MTRPLTKEERKLRMTMAVLVVGDMTVPESGRACAATVVRALETCDALEAKVDAAVRWWKHQEAQGLCYMQPPPWGPCAGVDTIEAERDLYLRALAIQLDREGILYLRCMSPKGPEQTEAEHAQCIAAANALFP